MPSLPKGNRRTFAVKSRADSLQKSFKDISKVNSSFYNSRQWRKLRLMILERDPLCKMCEKRGKIITANVVDHTEPINKGGDKLNTNNLQGLCTRCHNSKSAREKH